MIPLLFERVEYGWMPTAEIAERHLVTKGDAREHRGHGEKRVSMGAEVIGEEREARPIAIEGGPVGVQDVGERVCRERVEHDVDEVARG